MAKRWYIIHATTRSRIEWRVPRYPLHRLLTASLSGVVRRWHSNAYSSLFSSLFFFDFHRTNFSRFRRTFHSFDPVGFAIFANPAPTQPRPECAFFNEGKFDPVAFQNRQNFFT